MGFEPFSLLSKLQVDLAPKCLKPFKVLEKVELAATLFFTETQGRWLKVTKRSKQCRESGVQLSNSSGDGSW